MLYNTNSNNKRINYYTYINVCNKKKAVNMKISTQV